MRRLLYHGREKKVQNGTFFMIEMEGMREELVGWSGGIAGEEYKKNRTSNLEILLLISFNTAHEYFMKKIY